MAIPSRQIGWGTEDNLLWQISKQLEQLTNVTAKACANNAPTYKVYTALLTQSGGATDNHLFSGALTKGVTYTQVGGDVDWDFSNVGGPVYPNTFSFVATSSSDPIAWGGADMSYNTGAPVVTVLENTIGNIWFIYDEVGNYSIKSNGLFITNKTWIPTNTIFHDAGGWFTQNFETLQIFLEDEYSVLLRSYGQSDIDGVFNNTSIEIRVYS